MNNYWWLLILIALFGLYVLYIFLTKGRRAALVTLRLTAFKLMLSAEKVYKDKTGDEKFEIVVSKLYELLPDEVEFFISEQTFRDFIDGCYADAKDFLDDGKLNDSIGG